MKASELIVLLAQTICAHGDRDVKLSILGDTADGVKRHGCVEGQNVFVGHGGEHLDRFIVIQGDEAESESDIVIPR